MNTDFHKQFNKEYAKLPAAQKQRFEKVIITFRKNPYHRSLRNHALSGKWQGHRSISFGGDWRAHYIPKDDTALFVAIGTHSQLYGRVLNQQSLTSM